MALDKTGGPEYARGVVDGVALVTDQVSASIRRGLEIAEHEKPADDLGVISRERVVKYLQGLTRSLEGIAAQVQSVYDDTLGSDPRDGGEQHGNEDEGKTQEEG